MGGLCVPLFIALVVTVVQTRSSHGRGVQDDFCKFKRNGKYQDPYSCAGYIRCFSYRPFYRRCRGGKLFDPSTKRCKDAKNVDCLVGNLDCDVGIVGGGISGLFMAYKLLQGGLETNVCVFEKDTRFGGRILDYNFEQVEAVDVGLGAWRIDKEQKLMLQLVEELGVELVEWSFVKPNLIESRGIIADNEEDIKRGYVYLKNHPVFGNMSSGELWSYVSQESRLSTADTFSTVDSYFTHYITGEGAEFVGELSGYKGDFTEFIEPSSYMEFIDETSSYSGLYWRPVGGMSAIIDALSVKVKSLGAKIFSATEIIRIQEVEESGYELAAHHLLVHCPKLVIAVPPAPFQNIAGNIAMRLKSAPQFQSVQPIQAFKGAAVYDHAWWEEVKLGQKSLQPGQRYISNSNCLGSSMVHRDKGPDGAAVMHTMYSDGECARHWADVATLGREFLDKEVQRALEQKFHTKIPKPLDTVYQFWDSAWHFQKPGTKFSMEEISQWAKRPFPEKDIFVVGEAFHAARSWSEGCLYSTLNALREGWGVDVPNVSAKRSVHARNGETLSQRLLHKEIVRP